VTAPVLDGTRLTAGGFARAGDFLMARARPLERAAFLHEFEGGARAPVLEALRAFINPDGGFGRSLEPDFRAEVSSPLATVIGLRELARLDASPDEPLVRGAVAYLLANLEPGTLVWRILPHGAAATAPHAPWWDDADGSLERTFNGCLLSPRAELLAYLWRWASLVPGEVLAAVSASTAAAIEKDEAGGDLPPLIALASEPAVPDWLRGLARDHLRLHGPRNVQRTAEEFRSYGLPPFWLAPVPDSPAADLIEGALREHAAYLVSTQTPDGCWEPNWSWFGREETGWEQACEEWRGELTLRNLRAFRAFGLLEGGSPKG
jgi:hypothetical protein